MLGWVSLFIFGLNRQHDYKADFHFPKQKNLREFKEFLHRLACRHGCP